jgi:carbamate kinase
MQWLLDHDAIVIAAGGSGIPVTVAADGKTRTGVEAVIDKDLCGALLARQLDADLLLIATDVDAVFWDWHTPLEFVLHELVPDELRSMNFPPETMGPKVAAACEFAERTGRPAAIGSVDRIAQLANGTAGTRVTRGA